MSISAVNWVDIMNTWISDTERLKSGYGCTIKLPALSIRSILHTLFNIVIITLCIIITIIA